jgi:GrpB-like predicted nucleotidyltransferase (UPF0157 family)
MRTPPLPTPSPPLTPEQMAQRAVGNRPTEVTKPITISTYDPNWPVRFAQEETRIRAALGGRARTVEHVGSTAVPGPDCDEHLRHLVFRDWLRSHPDDRDRYAACKHEAAARHPLSMANYVHCKGANHGRVGCFT